MKARRALNEYASVAHARSSDTLSISYSGRMQYYKSTLKTLAKELELARPGSDLEALSESIEQVLTSAQMCIHDEIHNTESQHDAYDEKRLLFLAIKEGRALAWLQSAIEDSDALHLVDSAQSTESLHRAFTVLDSAEDGVLKSLLIFDEVFDEITELTHYNVASEKQAILTQAKRSLANIRFEKHLLQLQDAVCFQVRPDEIIRRLILIAKNIAQLSIPAEINRQARQGRSQFELGLYHLLATEVEFAKLLRQGFAREEVRSLVSSVEYYLSHVDLLSGSEEVNSAKLQLALTQIIGLFQSVSNTLNRIIEGDGAHVNYLPGDDTKQTSGGEIKPNITAMISRFVQAIVKENLSLLTPNTA